MNKRDVDRLIEEVTVDCYTEDEERSSFCVAIDACLGGGRVAVRVAGFDTTLTGVDDDGDRRGLRAKVRHGGRAHAVTLFDIELAEDADPELMELVAAYREWCRR
jgi:hypothetical protein